MALKTNPAADEVRKLEQREQRARYMKRYREEHPDYNRASWIKSAKRILTTAGYTIIAPTNDSGEA